LPSRLNESSTTLARLTQADAAAMIGSRGTHGLDC
jgi:hypothetical protein